MGELLAFSPFSLLLSPQFQLHSSKHGYFPIVRNPASQAVTSPMCFLSTRPTSFPITYSEPKQHAWKTRAAIASDSKVPTIFTVDSAGEGIDILPDSGGSSDNLGEGGGGGGGGGNGDNNDNTKGGSDGNEDQSGGSEEEGKSMSQILTLAYSLFFGIGGSMGYVKDVGVLVVLLGYVGSILPTNPILASSIGLGLSATLLGVMGSRFKKSGKIFPDDGILIFFSVELN
ncbi:hypothetical protein ACJIZ3_019156 [Penstemon smallii]|uniref:Uncharacterized protein n=1 Tax=Penstemon smallii TaxID=265156 RepID=A0ABD3T0D4_9LAMI